MRSEYPHPIAQVRQWNDGAGWRTDAIAGEGLVWLVEKTEPDPRDGTRDVYIIADTVELNEGRLELSLRGHPVGQGLPPVVFTRTFAPGVWREYHLVTDAKVIAEHTAELFKEDDE